MKLFGQFLIDERLITKEDFVAAMIIQAESLPSLPLAINELKLFDMDVQVDIFAYQARHFKEYRAACIDMGIWDETKVEHPLGRYFLSRLKPLGDILVEQGLITAEQVASALERYMALEESAAETPAKASAGNLTLVEKSRDKPSNVVPLKRSSLRSGHMEKHLHDLYCESFDDDALERFKTYFAQPTDTQRAQIVRELNALFQASSFILAFKSSDIFLNLLLLARAEPGFCQSDLQPVNEALDLAWRLRTGLLEGASEYLTLNADDLDNRIDKLCEILSQMSQNT